MGISSPFTGLVTVRPRAKPVFSRASAPRSWADSDTARFTYSRTSAESFSFSTSGCSGAITKKVAPNSVSGRVVNTG